MGHITKIRILVENCSNCGRKYQFHDLGKKHTWATCCEVRVETGLVL